MNFLAHQFLSFGQKKLQIGNLLGEFVKGNQYKEYEKDIQQGILLHRSIDSFTDNHSIVHHSSSYFYKTQRKFAPIVIDVLYDYYLIKNWTKYTDADFNVFKLNCYTIFREIESSYFIGLDDLITNLIKYDWFENYKTLEGVHNTLKGIGQRTRYVNNLKNALPELIKHESEIENDFLQFFPELLKNSKEVINVEFKDN